MADDTQTPQITLPDVVVTPQENPISAGASGQQPDIVQGQAPSAPPAISDGMIEARLNGYSWPEIDQHTANFQQAAAQAGYTQDQIDQQVGQPAPLDQFGQLPYKELHTDPQFPTQGVTRPLAPGEYMRNMDDSWSNEMSNTVKFDDGTWHNVPGLWLVNGHPTHLDEDQSAEMAQHSGLTFGNAYASEEEANADAQKREAQWQTTDPQSPQFLSTPSLWTGKVNNPSPIPTPKQAVDYSIGAALGAMGSMGALSVTGVKTTQDNMLKLSLRSGTNMQQLYQDSHNDPLLQDALGTPNSVASKQMKNLYDAATANPQPTYPTLKDLHEKPLEPVYFPFLGDIGAQLIIESGRQGIAQGTEAAAENLVTYLGGQLIGKYVVAPLLLAAKPAVVAAGKAIGAAAEDLAQEAKNIFGAVIRDEAGGNLGKPLVRVIKPIPNPLLGKPSEDFTKSRGGFTVLEDTLNRMEAQDDVEKQFILKMQKAMPAEWNNPKFQEDAYNYNETMGTSLHTPDPKFDEYNKFMEPLRNKELQLNYRLAQLTGRGQVKLQSWDQGYVHRILNEDMTGKLVSQSETGNTIGPVTNTGHGLSDWASSAQARHDWFMHDAGNGNRMWGGDLSNTEYKYGDTYTDPLTGKPVTITRPTSLEIEANTPYRYFKNHFINTAENVARLGQSVRHAEFINEPLKQMEAMGHYVPEERVPGGNFGPQGMLPVDVDQIKGFAVPRVAHALNDYFAPDKVPDFLMRLRAIGRFAMRWVFMNPIIHGENVGELYAKSRGANWLNPVGYVNAGKYLAKAAEQVANFGDDYLQHRAEGAAFQKSGIETRNFLAVLHKRMGVEMANNQNGIWALIAKATGVDLPGMVKSVENFSHGTLWGWQDTLALARQYELMDKGMLLREAIFQSEKDMANYRLPSTVLGSRMLRTILNEPALDLFGRYHYGIARSIALQARDAVGPGMTMGQRLTALGKVIPQAAMTYGLWPALGLGLTAAGRAMTGDPNLNIEASPRGDQVPLWALAEAAKASHPWENDAGNKWVRFMQSFGQLAPGAAMLKKLVEVGGQDDEWPQKMYKLIEAAAQNALPPFEWAQQAAKPNGLFRAIGQQLGFKITPDSEEEAKQAKGIKFGTSLANSQSKHDGFVNWLSDLFNTPIPGGTGSPHSGYHIPSGNSRGYSGGPRYSNKPRYK